MTGRIDSDPSARSVVLLADPRWPDRSGVCCWRRAVRAAFESGGAVVREVVLPRELLGSAPRTSSLRVVRVAWRGMAAARQRVRRWGMRARRFATTLAADLVVAESPEAAALAIALGVEGRTVWPLALPTHALPTGAGDAETRAIADLAPHVGGFLTIDAVGRESVERAAAATSRPRVEVFPPDAAGCPICTAGDAPQPAESPFVFARSPDRSGLGRTAWAGDAEPGPAGDAEPGPAGEAEPGPGAADGGSDRPADDDAAAERVRVASRILDAVPRRRVGTPARAVVVSGYDLKFARDLAAGLSTGYGLRLDLDEWPGLATRSARTRFLTARADTIFAEWARPSAAWLARRKRPGQVLVVRLHRYELTTDYPAAIDIDRVDAVVHVSRHVGREIVERLGWPESKLVHIPNYVDIEAFARPKLPGARFGIGAVGIELANKRFDLMLDVVAAVRRQDPRFTLFVRSTLPWANRFGWARAAEREYVDRWLRRIETDPLLRGGVVFDPPGRDMARWYRRVGSVLSTSDIESFHMAVAEGMASGAVPVIRPRPGAEEIFGPQWIHPTLDDAVATILSFADEATWEGQAAKAKDGIRRVADPAEVLAAWAEVLRGDVSAAQRRFG